VTIAKKLALEYIRIRTWSTFRRGSDEYPDSEEYPHCHCLGRVDDLCWWLSRVESWSMRPGL